MRLSYGWMRRAGRGRRWRRGCSFWLGGLDASIVSISGLVGLVEVGTEIDGFSDAFQAEGFGDAPLGVGQDDVGIRVKRGRAQHGLVFHALANCAYQACPAHELALDFREVIMASEVGRMS
jgi:hypothetical protein